MNKPIRRGRKTTLSGPDKVKQPASCLVGNRLRFSKMQGAGNDFVVLDLRAGTFILDSALVARLADRHYGIGCDQIMGIEPPRSAKAVASYRIWNADGSLAQQCGNGARAVAAWLVREKVARDAHFVIDSPTSSHRIERLQNGDFAVTLGVPQFTPEAIPLRGFVHARPEYILSVRGDSVRFGVVSLGNPHAVLEVGSVETAPVEHIGTLLQQHVSFPESVNVSFAQVIDSSTIRLRVFERGVGETLACGSAACAAVAVLIQRGRLQREVQVTLPGGALCVHWPNNATPIMLSGPATFVFEGHYFLENVPEQVIGG